MSPDFRSLSLGFSEFWGIQLPKSPSRSCWVGRIVNEARNRAQTRCHPIRGYGFIIPTTDGFHRRLYAVATIVAEKSEVGAVGR